MEGYQFFYKENSNKLEVTEILLKNIEVFATKNNILSCNFLYIDKGWEQLLNKYNYHKWINIRSQWESIGEENFEEFLNRFNSNQRKNIKKERKSINNQNIKIKIFTENNIDEDLMNSMHLFYEQHCLRWGVWGSKYLTDDFFKNSQKTKENYIIFSAFEENSTKPIAMSMCIKNKENLWGRYWGSLKEINYLHFELCYYQPIEWAIKNKIKYFDPGAGGQHKRRRGFYAKGTTSLHKWFNYNMENLIVQWLNKVNKETLVSIQDENNSIPFKQ